MEDDRAVGGDARAARSSSWQGPRAARASRRRQSRPCRPRRRCRAASAPATASRGSEISSPPAPSSSCSPRARRRRPRRRRARRAMRQRAGDVVAVADVGDAKALERAEALAQGLQVGERLAGVVQRGERVDDRHVGRSASSATRSCEPERIAIACDEAREDRAVSPIDSPRRDLHLVAAQDDRVAAELGDADLEGDPRAGRRHLEEQCDRAAGERVGAVRRPGRLELGRALEQRRQLGRAELLAGEEVRRPWGSAASYRDAPGPAAGRLRGRAGVDTCPCGRRLFARSGLEPVPRARSSARARAAHLALAAAAATERGTTHAQVNCDLFEQFATCSPTRSGTSRCCRSARRAGPRTWRLDCGPRPTSCSPPATSRRCRAPAAARPAQPRPDRLLGGRLEPDAVRPGAFGRPGSASGAS